MEQLDANPLMNRNLTLDGQMLGTPDFVAPEQIVNAQAADIRADIYSLGCTLYYLLSGRAPFSAETLYDILQAHGSRDARLLNVVRPDVPSELAALVAKMMAKDPDRRFQAPYEVAKALTPFYRQTSKTVVSHGSGVPPLEAPATSPSTAGSSQDSMISGRTRATSAPRDRDRAEEMWKSLFDLVEAEDIQPVLPGPGRRVDPQDHPVGQGELEVQSDPKPITSRPKRKRRRQISPAVARRLGCALILLCTFFGVAIVGFSIGRPTRNLKWQTRRQVVAGRSAGGEVVDGLADTPSKQAPKNLIALEGLYRLDPFENDWHEGTITLDGPEGADGKRTYRWTNRAGVSWQLIYEPGSLNLRTGPDNPYHRTTPEFLVILKKDWLGAFLPEPEGFQFQGFYKKVGP